MCYKWKRQDADGACPPFTSLGEVTAAPDGHQRKRIKIQDLIRHTMLLCGEDAQTGSLAMQPGEGVDQGDLIRDRQRQGREGSVSWKQQVWEPYRNTTEKMEEQAKKCL